MVEFARSKATEAGLPAHVVNLYVSESDQFLTTRMRNIVRKFLLLSSDNQQAKTESQEILLDNLTMYSKVMEPEQRRKTAAVKEKMGSFLDSSDDSSSGSERESVRKRQRKVDSGKEAQNAHTKMCEKAMDTMENVNKLLSKVDSYLSKNKN